MKAGLIKLHAECFIELTENEVAIINHYLSYDTSIAQIHSISDKYTKAEVKEVFGALKQATDRIMYATGDARKNIFDERYTRSEIKPLHAWEANSDRNE